MHHINEKLILKEKAEDFEVIEILPKNFASQEETPFYLYKVEKINVSHSELLKMISPYFTKPLYFAGMKDKKAKVTQFFTCEEKVNDFELVQGEKKVKIEWIGYAKEHLKIGGNEGNHFRIKTNKFRFFKEVAYIGCANYFDEQRFGNKEFFALIKALMKNDYEKALKKYLIRYSKNEETNKLRKILKENWENLNEMPESLLNKIFKGKKQIVLDYSLKKDYKNAFLSLYKKDILYYYRQFQSFLWNELLKEIVKDFEPIKYRGLLFNTKKLPKIQLDLPNEQADYGKYNKKFENVLKRIEISKKDLEKNVFGEEWPKGKRNLSFFPKDMKQEKHDTFSWVEFTLPKGCYATIVIKHLFAINYLKEG